MVHFRCYFLTDADHIFDAADVTADTPDEAAHQLISDERARKAAKIEVWRGVERLLQEKTGENCRSA